MLLSFLRDSSGRVATNGWVIYVIVLGLFITMTVSMRSDDGPRTLQASAGPNWIIDLGAVFGDGTGLPQIGPLHAER